MNNNIDTQDINKKLTDDVLVPQKSFLKNKKFIYAVSALIIVTIIAGLYLTSFKPLSTSTNTTVTTSPTAQKPSIYPTGKINPSGTDNKIIARVGAEDIYRKNVETLILGEARAKGVDYEKIFLDKLIEESIILQSARKAKLTVLDSSVFNSETLDLNRRSALVKQIKETIEQKADKIEGSIISIWFNNGEVGPLGLEGGKKMAFDKIKPLQEQVKNGTMTVVQAGEAVKNDTSLKQLDKVYDVNAISSFSVNKGSKITFDVNFDQILWGLTDGGTSEVVLIQGLDDQTQKLVDSLYAFGRVSKRTGESGNLGFEAWYKANLNTYEIQYL